MGMKRWKVLENIGTGALEEVLNDLSREGWNPSYFRVSEQEWTIVATCYQPDGSPEDLNRITADDYRVVAKLGTEVAYDLERHDLLDEDERARLSRLRGKLWDKLDPASQDDIRQDQESGRDE